MRHPTCKSVRRVETNSSMQTTLDVEVTSADELFVNLDGAILPTESGNWQIEVCGIHEADHRYWVQLNLVGPDCYSMTLRADALSANSIRRQIAGCLHGLVSPVLASRAATV